ncbi:MAG: hypothetical protein ACREAA_16155 [Candidatus Polarisedimenticolia bacterium]
MRRILIILGLTMAAVLLLPSEASAAVSFDVGVLWNPDPGSDTQVFLHASNIAYPAPRTQVVPVFEQIEEPSLDYPVLAFVAYNARADVRTVWAYRSRGNSWFEVMAHFGVRPDALFVALPSDPGPPYGNAYGYWRKHGNRMRPRYVDDDDVRFWVRIRTTARYVGITPARAYEWNAQGRRCEKVTSARYREKHGKGHRNDSYDSAGFGGPGKSKKKGNKKGHD